MNFYFNYFTSIGREQSICHLSSVITFSCLFLKKVDFPTEFVYLSSVFVYFVLKKADCYRMQSCLSPNKAKSCNPLRHKKTHKKFACARESSYLCE